MSGRRGRRVGDDAALHVQNSSHGEDFTEPVPVSSSTSQPVSQSSFISSRMTRSKAACNLKRKTVDKRHRVVHFEDDVVELDDARINLNKKARRKGYVVKSEFDGTSGSELKTWEYFTPKDKQGNRPINVHCNKEISSELKQRLSGDLYERFKATCFGHFLEFPAFHVQNQVLVALLFREVVRPSDDVLFFIINNQKLKFGLREFALVTGLKCVGDFMKDYSSKEDNRLVVKYFGGVDKVSKSALEDCFKNKRWDNDDDAIKIAALYLINTFLYSTKNSETNPHYIDSEHFDIIESGEWESYPWGYKLYLATIESLHNKVSVWKSSFRFAGMPYALLVWFFECCPTVHGKLANRVGNKVPRILNWEVTRHLSFNEVQRGFSSLTGDKMVVHCINATDIEIQSMNLPVESETNIDVEIGCQVETENVGSDASVQVDEDSDILGRRAGFMEKMDVFLQEQAVIKKEILANTVVVAGLKEFMVSTAARLFNELEQISNKLDAKGVEKDVAMDGAFSFGGFGSDNEAGCDVVNVGGAETTPLCTPRDINVPGCSAVNSEEFLNKMPSMQGAEGFDKDDVNDPNLIVPRRLDFGEMGKQDENGDGIESLSTQELNIIDESVEKRLQESASRKVVVGITSCRNDVLPNIACFGKGELVHGNVLSTPSNVPSRIELSEVGSHETIDTVIDSMSIEDFKNIDATVEKKLEEAGKRKCPVDVVPHSATAVCIVGDQTNHEVLVSDMVVFSDQESTGGNKDIGDKSCVPKMCIDPNMEAVLLDSITTDDLINIDENDDKGNSESVVCNSERSIGDRSSDMALEVAAGGYPNFRIFDTQEEAEIYGRNDVPSGERSNSVISELLVQSLDVPNEFSLEEGCTKVDIYANCDSVDPMSVDGCAVRNTGQGTDTNEDLELISLFKDIDEYSEKELVRKGKSVAVVEKRFKRLISKPKSLPMRNSLTCYRSPVGCSSANLVSRGHLAVKSVFARQHPFSCKPWRRLDSKLKKSFSSWIKTRMMKNRDPPYHFTANILRPKFDFGVCLVSSKEWFHTLYSVDNPLQETHIDVILYYMRKMAKHDPSVNRLFTTTDCLFDSTIRDIYKSYMKNNKRLIVDSDNHIISDYMKGLSIRCNMPWPLVDDVLLPIKVVDDWHWILGRLCFKKRVLYVYDSKLDNFYYDDELIRAVEPYAILIPIFLSAMGFYEMRDDMNPADYIFGDKPNTEKWEVLHIYDMTGVRKSDYGVFALTLAEHFMHGRDPPSSGCNIGRFRKHFGALLWDYGLRKLEANQNSDAED